MDGHQSTSRFIFDPQSHFFVAGSVASDEFFEFMLNGFLKVSYFFSVFLGLLGRGTFALAPNLYLTKLCTVE